MTKETIDMLFETQFSNIKSFEDKFDLDKYYDYIENGSYNNLLYELYKMLDEELKEYFYYKCLENGLEEYTILFDNDIKNSLCNKIINNPEDYDSSLLHNLNAIKIRKTLLLSENEKIETFKKMDDRDKAIGISSLRTDQEKVELLKYINDEFYLFSIIASFDSDNLKIKYINSINLKDSYSSIPSDFYVMISSFKDENIKCEIISNLIKEGIGRIEDYTTPLLSFENVEYIKKIVNTLDCDRIDKIRNSNIIDNKIIFADIDLVLRKYFDNDDEFEYAKSKFIEISKKNYVYMSKANIKLLRRDFCSKFDEEYLDEILLYPDIQEKIIKIADDSQKIDIVSNLLNLFVKEYGKTRWNVFFEKIVDRIISDEYASIINVSSLINETNIEKLYGLLKQDNDFCIQSEVELANFDHIKSDICDKLIRGEELSEKYKKINSLTDLERRQYAILQKIYGIDIVDAKRLLNFYGTDIENLKSDNYKTQVCKKFIKSISYILNETNINVLTDLYNMDMALEKISINTIMIEQELQSAYMREYNEVLFNPLEDGKIIKKDGIITYIDAGVDFNILMTSVAAYYMKKIDDYKTSWSNTIDFCGSFIRNDMLGTAQIPNVCFGFSSMDESSLLFSDPSNISSKARFFNTRAGNKNITFCTPDSQINQRGEDFAKGKEKSYLYNEMVFKKKNNDNIKQPDYILVFKENEIINNLDEAIKASNDFGGIPIVIIDKEKCAISELNKIKELIIKYNETKEEEYLYQIKIKVQNNMVSNEYFKNHIGEIIGDLNLEIDYKKINPNNSDLLTDVHTSKDDNDKMLSEFEKIDEVYGKIHGR